MNSASLAIIDHQMTELNDPGFDQVRGVFPLEIQEHIIGSGPRETEEDRVAFLCLCALVCKDWLARSRSALALKVTIDTDSPFTWHHSQSFLQLVKYPNTTLARSVKRLDVMDYEALVIAGPYLPSVQELTIHGSDIVGVAELLQLLKHSMSSVRFLSLVAGAFGNTHDFLAIFNFFPSIHSLEISFPTPIDPLNDRIFQTFGVPGVGLTELIMEIYDKWDIYLLGSILRLVQGLQKLQIRDTKYYPDIVSDWALENPLKVRGEIEVSYDLVCSNGDKYENSINKDCANFFSMFDSLHIAQPHLEHLEKVIPLWISYGSARLKYMTFTTLDATLPDEFDEVDWTALSSSLGGAKQLKDVRFVDWDSYESIPAYIEALKVLAHPHFSLSVQMSEDPDSIKQLVV